MLNMFKVSNNDTKANVYLSRSVTFFANFEHILHGNLTFFANFKHILHGNILCYF